jgi:hypothetical protein
MFSTSAERCGVLVYAEHNISWHRRCSHAYPNAGEGLPAKRITKTNVKIIQEYWKARGYMSSEKQAI